TFVNMLHLGRGVFGSDFGTTAFVISKNLISQYKGVYRKLFKKQGAVDSLKQKEKWLFENFGYFNIDQNRISEIPGSQIAYWISNSIISTFSDNENISSRFIPKFGMSVGEGQRYIREWYEVQFNKIKFNASSDKEFIKSNKKYAVLD